jgi:hypothetical protein
MSRNDLIFFILLKKVYVDPRLDTDKEGFFEMLKLRGFSLNYEVIIKTRLTTKKSKVGLGLQSVRSTVRSELRNAVIKAFE